MDSIKPLITDLALPRLRDELESLGEPAFRWKQVATWLYQKRAGSFADMTNVSKACRERLAQKFRLEKPGIEYCLESSRGDAVKFGLAAGEDIIETVLLHDRTRRTACISSQLGCALGCTFCETGSMGFVRNLTLHEVLSQVIACNDYLDSKGDKVLTNAVFMGMGEALSNLDVFLPCIEVLTDEHAFRLAQKRITVSTAGVVPSIRKLTASGLNIGLAISLNAYSNAARDGIMPINKRYPIEELVKAADGYSRATGTQVTFEYVVVHGENDTPAALDALVRLLGRLRCKVNLIPINPSTTNPDPRIPSDNDLRQFAEALYARGITVTKRLSRGQDIRGACGQLASRRPRAT